MTNRSLAQQRTSEAHDDVAARIRKDAAAHPERKPSEHVEAAERMEGEEPGFRHCTGLQFGVQADDASASTYGYNQGFNYLKGYWLVRLNPGMRQGLGSVTLIAADPE